MNNDSEIFILFINGIGDAILTIPLINYLFERFGKKMIIIAPNDINSYVYSNINCLKYSISFNRDCDNPFIKYQSDIKNLFLEYPKKAHQILISLNAYYPYWQFEDEIRNFYNFDFVYDFEKYNCKNNKVPMLFQYLNILGLKIDIERYRFINIKFDDLNEAKKNCSKISTKYDNIVTIHCDTTFEKEWPKDYWNDFMFSLHQELNCFIFLLGVIRPINNYSFIKTIKPDWHKQIAYLKESDYFFGIDSCWAHVADTFNKRGIVLFSKNSDSKVWGPMSKNLHQIVKNDLKEFSSLDLINYFKKLFK